ncbi:MAG: phenol hydroxylase [Gammaproteobacteria bacterium]
MSIEIRTTNTEPLRQSYAHIQRFQGKDKAASRYLEGSLGLQMETNFHYRPIWAPEYEIFDKRRTAIQVQEWDRYKDPRQMYYATYTIARARQAETVERNFDFIEQQQLLESLDQNTIDKILESLIPLRHLEWGANMNSCSVLDYGWSTAVTQPFMYDAMDRLAIAQQLTRIGMLMTEDPESMLDQARSTWTDADYWQPMRQVVEDTLVIQDWFELFIAQKIAIDGLLLPLVYGHLLPAISTGAGLPLAVNFIQEWLTESQRWVDALVKFTAKESSENRALLRQWNDGWISRVAQAAQPYVAEVVGPGTEELIINQRNELVARLAKAGVNDE